MIRIIAILALCTLALPGLSQNLDWKRYANITGVLETKNVRLLNDSTLVLLNVVGKSAKLSNLQVELFRYPSMKHIGTSAEIPFAAKNIERKLLSFGQLGEEVCVVLSEYLGKSREHRVVGYKITSTGEMRGEAAVLARKQLSSSKERAWFGFLRSANGAHAYVVEKGDEHGKTAVHLEVTELSEQYVKRRTRTLKQAWDNTACSLENYRISGNGDIWMRVLLNRDKDESATHSVLRFTPDSDRPNVLRLEPGDGVGTFPMKMVVTEANSMALGALYQKSGNEGLDGFFLTSYPANRSQGIAKERYPFPPEVLEAIPSNMVMADGSIPRLYFHSMRKLKNGHLLLATEWWQHYVLRTKNGNKHYWYYCSTIFLDVDEKLQNPTWTVTPKSQRLRTSSSPFDSFTLMTQDGQLSTVWYDDPENLNRVRGEEPKQLRKWKTAVMVKAPLNAEVDPACTEIKPLPEEDFPITQVALIEGTDVTIWISTSSESLWLAATE